MSQWTSEGLTRLREASSLATATAAVHGGASGLLFLAFVTWVPGRSPRSLLAILAAASVMLMFYAVRRGDRLSLREAYAMTVALMAVICLLTLTTGINLGALAAGSLLPMLGFYIVWFFPGRPGRILLYGACLVWIVAIVQHRETLLTGLAVSLILQVVIAAEVFAAVRARSDQLARRDVLTGVVNRLGITEAGAQHLNRLQKRGIPFSVISIDLDGLRDVNNLQGHRAGDSLLVEACRHWASRLRAQDLLGRIGGDEFLIVLPGSGAFEAIRVKQRLEVDATLSWSAGVAQARSDDNLATLMHRADERMYRQKAERSAS